MKKIIVVLMFVIMSNHLFSQTSPFDIHLEAITIPNLAGLQSFSVGQANGKWLIVGGRKDGLHRRQPFASFDVAGHNTNLIVVDPATLQTWSSSITSLSTNLQEQLSSTNMQFIQEGDFLYCLGGYGYSSTLNDHTTYPFLTAIKVSNVIDAVINQTNFTSFFRQITDSSFQVTGGRLRKIYDKYYLAGGQKFIGRYNPMGPTHGPGFFQEYTNSIRIFTLDDNGTTISINHLPSHFDSIHLHRRDFNVEAQILPNGQEGITLFSGVFQPTVDLPFLNSVTVDSNSYQVNNTFQQYYNHYHCAALPLYSTSKNEMHTLFFGGIAQYYDSSNVLVQNNNVPFVKTIARVTRDLNGVMKEYKLPVEMPTYIGAGSELIINKTQPHFNNEILNLDQITNDTSLVGYIFGGIHSSASNIFFINTGTESMANSNIFKVNLIQNHPNGIHQLNTQSVGSLKIQVFPNPNNGFFTVFYNLIQNENVTITISDYNGKIVDRQLYKNQPKGENRYDKKVKKLGNKSVYFLTIETSYEKATQKIIIEE